MEKDVVKYFLQRPETQHLIPKFSPKIFLLKESQVVFEILRGYTEKYSTLPSKHGLKFYIEREAELEPSFLEYINAAIDDYFEPPGDPGLLQEIIIENCQQAALKKTITELAPKIGEITDKDIAKAIQELQILGHITARSASKLVSLLDPVYDSDVDSFPTIFKQLNKFTTTGGFYSPQLIVLVSQPKSFKTGTLLNMALGYARMGLRVMYIDFENGLKPMMNRSKQCLLDCTFKELMSAGQLLTESEITLTECFKMQLEWIQRLGGDFKLGYYPAKVTTLDEIEPEIEAYKPHVIFWDYLDLAAPPDKKKDIRLGIQENYHHVVRINSKYNCFSFTISQINRNGSRKKRIKPEDIGEDYGKIMNAHALFALNREDEDSDEVYLSVLAQRDGVKHGEFKVLINEETQQANEFIL